MHVWNVLHVARRKYRTQKIAITSPPGHHLTTLSGCIFATKALVDNRKNLLISNISSTCIHNMVNFGPLMAQIRLPVWGTPANFNGFRVLACVTARHSSTGRQPNSAALNRGRHLYSAGRPSRWALATNAQQNFTKWVRLHVFLHDYLLIWFMVLCNFLATHWVWFCASVSYVRTICIVLFHDFVICVNVYYA